MVIDQGRYRGVVEDYGVFRSTAGQQHPWAFVRFRLEARYNEATGQWAGCATESREYAKAITDKTIDWVLADLKQVGYTGDGLRQFDPEAPGAVNLFGREIEVVCEHETYRDSTRESWSVYREPRRRVGADVLAALDARYADKLRRTLGKDKPAPVVTAAPNNDDPF
jgi:hypothetical protein